MNGSLQTTYPPAYVAATSFVSFGIGLAIGSTLWGD